MKKTFAVRLGDAERQALEELSKSSGDSVSDLIRQAIENLVLETKMNGGRLFLMAATDSGKRFLAEETLRELAEKHGTLDQAPSGHPLLSPAPEKIVDLPIERPKRRSKAS